MATKLNKILSREVDILGLPWIISLIPATPSCRFPSISFRPKGCRTGGPSDYTVPAESARNHAAERTRAVKKLAKFGN